MQKNTYFINQWGKRQHVPQGYYYNTLSGRLERCKNVSVQSKQQEIKEVAIYNDAVKFKFTGNVNDRESMVDAAQQAFGSVAGGWRNIFNNEEYVICRPDQFARFLIYRAKLVTVNRFAELDAQLVDSPKPIRQPIDVTGN